MGRIKQASLKRVANELMKNYGDEFATEFDSNKEKVQEHSDVKSKRIRNRIAGYTVRVMKKKEEEERRERGEAAQAAAAAAAS
jgi:small subunit ribosomal protein S17e